MRENRLMQCTDRFLKVECFTSDYASHTLSICLVLKKVLTRFGTALCERDHSSAMLYEPVTAEISSCVLRFLSVHCKSGFMRESHGMENGMENLPEAEPCLSLTFVRGSFTACLTFWDRNAPMRPTRLGGGGVRVGASLTQRRLRCWSRVIVAAGMHHRSETRHLGSCRRERR